MTLISKTLKKIKRQVGLIFQNNIISFDTTPPQGSQVIDFEEISSYWNGQYIFSFNENDRKLLFVLKQIARGNFLICSETECYIKLDSNMFNADYTRINSESIPTKKLLEMISSIEGKEDPEKRLLNPSYRKGIMSFMGFQGEDSDSIKKMDIIPFLYGHKKMSICNGSDHQDMLLAKLYFASKPSDDISKFRESKFASYINYDEQLEKQCEGNKIIYDEQQICGLWAFDATRITEYFSKGCYSNHSESLMDHYGSKLLILKMVPNVDYYIGEKETIGPKFKVIKQYDLFKVHDIEGLDILLHGRKTEFSDRMIREMQTIV